LIREVVQEVYSQQDEGIMDFIKNPFGKNTGSTGKRSDPKNIKEIYENNSKAIKDIVAALDRKRHEIKNQLYKLEANGIDWYANRTSDGGYEQNSGANQRIWNPDRAEQGNAASKTRFQEKTKQLKELIHFIEGTAGFVREFERFQEESVITKPYRINSSVYVKDLNDYVEKISDSLRRYGLDTASKLLKQFPSA